jgi:hypothetical protein
MSHQKNEPFEEKRKRFIREHEHDLDEELRPRHTPWPKNDPPQTDPRDKSDGRRRRGQ